MEFCQVSLTTGHHSRPSLPFWLQVTLQDQVEIGGEDSEAITSFLEGKVERMIQKARSRAVGGRPTMLPLIRLRVNRQPSMLICSALDLIYSEPSTWHANQSSVQSIHIRSRVSPSN